LKNANWPDTQIFNLQFSIFNFQCLSVALTPHSGCCSAGGGGFGFRYIEQTNQVAPIKSKEIKAMIRIITYPGFRSAG
jgi:hypothetical protein